MVYPKQAKSGAFGFCPAPTLFPPRCTVTTELFLPAGMRLIALMSIVVPFPPVMYLP